MSQRQLDEHRSYLADERRTAAYRAALAEVVRPSDVVLDLGAGTGLLGYLACDAGARSVIAVDRGDIVGLARELAVANGYGDRITHVQALSTELWLETPIDVVVCDQIGGLVHDAGILGCFADARRRLLAPGGRLVPASFRIFLAPVSFERGRAAVDFWSAHPADLDAEAARALAANTEWSFSVTADDLEALAPGRELAAFDADHDDPITGSADFEADRGGQFDGYLGWFEAQMSPSVTLTNDPWSPERFERWCNFYPLDGAIALAPGDRVRLDLDIRPRLGVVSWTTRVTHRTGQLQERRGSTFNGSFLTQATIDGMAKSQPIRPTPRIEVLERALSLIDGTTSPSDIADALADQIGTVFASRSHVERFVHSVAELIRT